MFFRWINKRAFQIVSWIIYRRWKYFTMYVASQVLLDYDQEVSHFSAIFLLLMSLGIIRLNEYQRQYFSFKHLGDLKRIWIINFSYQGLQSVHGDEKIIGGFRIFLCDYVKVIWNRIFIFVIYYMNNIPLFQLPNFSERLGAAFL